MYACIPDIDGGFLQGVCTPRNATAIFRDPPPPHHATQKDRSPSDGAPAGRGLLAALPWAALWPGVEVNHHPPSARAPLACHPRITLDVVHTPRKASHACALLVRTRFCSCHDLMP